MNRASVLSSCRFAIGICALLFAIKATWAAPITIATVPVGDPGNAADGNGLGAVGYSYSIGQYDVTAAQYTVFLNAVAKTDTYALYDSLMGSGLGPCGISRSGSSGNYTYTDTGNADYPVNWVSFWRACRFVNWLQNGQPTGVEGPGTTETGTYTLTTTAMDNNTVSRNAGVTWALPTNDEWYKAAYYKGGGTNAGYWQYPTQSNTAPINTLPDTGNHSNFYDSNHTGNGTWTDPTNYLTPVGAFDLSAGPYDTFDQGGDVSQWTETAPSGSTRGMRGGSFGYGSYDLSSSYGETDSISSQAVYWGFRVVELPEPGCLGILAIAAIGLGLRRRQNRVRG